MYLNEGVLHLYGHKYCRFLVRIQAHFILSASLIYHINKEMRKLFHLFIGMLYCLYLYYREKYVRVHEEILKEDMKKEMDILMFLQRLLLLNASVFSCEELYIRGDKHNLISLSLFHSCVRYVIRGVLLSLSLLSIFICILSLIYKFLQDYWIFLGLEFLP